MLLDSTLGSLKLLSLKQMPALANRTDGSELVGGVWPTNPLVSSSSPA